MANLYSFLHYLIMPWVLARLLLRGLRNRGYWQRIAERFGFVPAPESGAHVVWVHAVSVGEVQAALPLLNGLLARRPGIDLLVTTTTPTGAERLLQAMGGQVRHCFMPYDLPGAMRRFLATANPALAIVFETEVWPNMLKQCARRDIPVVLANARLSERSAGGYQRLGALAREAFGRFTVIAAQTEDDARRLIGIGARRERVRVTGSIKFDVKLTASVSEQAQVMRRCWGVDRSVWIAASTHEGEEEQVLQAFALVLAKHSDLLLTLVPRHPERAPKVAALARKRGFHTVLRTEGRQECNGIDVFVGDTLGELPVFYGAADVAFVGGSLVPVGGHNVLEPAALGVPVIVGPYVHNFAEITRRLQELAAAREVKSVRALADTITEFLDDADLRHATGERGREFVERNRGALEHVLDMLEPYLSVVS